MKILHIANEVVDTGNGIANAAVDLACSEAELGHSVSFISSGGAYVKLLADYHVSHHEIRQKPSRMAELAIDIPRLRSIVRDIRPDIVHAHMMLGAVLMRMGRDLFGFGDYGLVTTVHNEWRKASQLMLAGDRIIMLSESGRSRYVRRGFPKSKLSVVKHGILNAPRLRHAADLDPLPNNIDFSAPVIATVAGLYKRKGIGDLMDAFGRIADEFPTASLIIMGWGPDRELFEEQRKRIRGGDRIHFLGFVSNPRAILERASIFVLPSHTESFPLALCEARAAGCAVIGTTVGGVPELLENGAAGLLVPPHDPAALATVFRRVLRDPQELERWKAAASSNLEWLQCERMTRETLNVYESVLEERRARRKRHS
jgi:glycosyltransferase involved in cell wall biosynthesis